MTSSDASVLVERQDRVALVTLNRSDKRNAINNEVIRELHAVFADPGADLGAIVLQGAGEHFCAGLDLAESFELKLDAMARFVTRAAGIASST